MAYFPNGSAGMCFDDQCYKCIMYERSCPIAWAQMEYNYEACNNETARKILGSLVADNGNCSMYGAAPEIFMTAEERGQLGLFNKQDTSQGPD